MNGVCVTWRGWVDLQRLDGIGYMEYDEERAMVSNENSIQISSQNCDDECTHTVHGTQNSVLTWCTPNRVSLTVYTK